jgi:hypothetical protein
MSLLLAQPRRFSYSLCAFQYIFELENVQLTDDLATPPGAVCHADQPTYDANLCPTIEMDWILYQFHSGDPVSSAWNNFNNDTCIPDPTLPCSGLGYPQYVVNATSAEEVAAGVKFANSHNLSLIVKGTGHDYMGRQVEASLSSINS